MYTEQQRQILLQVARDSISYGLQHGSAMPVQAGDYEQELQEERACFVTLNKQGELRGCIGSLQAHRPLVEDVAENAFAAAFKDPRFYPFKEVELGELEIHISVLSPATPMEFSSEADLLSQVRPGIDGLILEEGFHRGTFLPSVWEQLPTTKEFLAHLKRKAGLPMDYWSDKIEISRYETEMF